MDDPLKEDYYISIQLPEYGGRFFRVVAKEPFTYETGTSTTAEFSSVAAGSESGYKNIDVLEPDERPRKLFYVKWGVADSCQYYLKVPTGTDRLGTDEDKDVGFITVEKSPYFDMNPAYAFWLVHDYYPAINAKNVTADTVTPKVWFEGMKYELEEVTDPDIIEKLRNYEKRVSPSIPFKKITIGGVR